MHLPLAGAERNSALQDVGLAQVMPAHKPHSVPGDMQFLTSSTYRRAKLSESARLLAAELRSAPAGVFIKPLSATGLEGMPRISQANHAGRPSDTAKPPGRYRKYW